MTPYEMEEQLKNIDARATAIEQFLRTLATKDDLKAFATKDELRLTTEALQHEIIITRDDLKAGLEDSKRYTLLLIQATRGEIRQQVGAVADDVRRIAEQVAIMSTQLTGVSQQVAALSSRGRKK